MGLTYHSFTHTLSQRARILTTRVCQPPTENHSDQPSVRLHTQQLFVRPFARPAHHLIVRLAVLFALHRQRESSLGSPEFLVLPCSVRENKFRAAGVPLSHDPTAPNQAAEPFSTANIYTFFHGLFAAGALAGDTVEVLPGDRFPVDGVVLDGRTAADESSLTGTSLRHFVSRREACVVLAMSSTTCGIATPHRRSTAFERFGCCAPLQESRSPSRRGRETPCGRAH